MSSGGLRGDLSSVLCNGAWEGSPKRPASSRSHASGRGATPFFIYPESREQTQFEELGLEIDELIDSFAGRKATLLVLPPAGIGSSPSWTFC